MADTNGDDKADVSEIVMSGFDDHDTHHAIGAYCADPSGAIIMNEGVFLRTNVETAYKTVRGTDGGFYRFDVSARSTQLVVSAGRAELERAGRVRGIRPGRTGELSSGSKKPRVFTITIAP